MGARRGLVQVVAVLAGVGMAAAAGCGGGHPPTAFTDYLPDAAVGAQPPNQFDLDATFPPPKCEVVTADGGICGCTDVPLQTDAPTIYFVLDRSGSMTQDNKWQTVRSVTQQLVTAVGPRASFGAAVFPNPAADDCSGGLEVMRPRRGDAPAGTAGFTTRTLAAATNVVANGGTPTAQTLRNLKSHLTGIGGKVFVILATDGGPNCNPYVQCDVAACIPNIESASPGCLPNTQPNCCLPSNYGPASCLDAQTTVQAVTELEQAGIDTYVVGVPGSGPYASVLDQLAQAGHTARASEPFYYRVDTADEAALLTALSQIAAKIIATCTLPLSGPPADPSLVNVFIDEQPVAKDAVNGWTLDGATVTLVGTTCDRVLSGSALDVRVIEGCPTVGPR
jgi:hypothetical protein